MGKKHKSFKPKAMSTKNLVTHMQSLGIAIAKIDTTLIDTPNIPVDELVKQFKKRTDLQDVAGFVNYLIAAKEEQAKKESPIIQM